MVGIEPRRHQLRLVVGTPGEAGTAACVADPGLGRGLELVMVALAAGRAGEAPGDPFDYGRFVIRREPWPEAERVIAESISATGEGRF